MRLLVPCSRAPADAVNNLLGHAALNAAAAEPLVVLVRPRQRRLDGGDAEDVVRSVAELAQDIRLVIDLLADAARRVPELLPDIGARRRLGPPRSGGPLRRLHRRVRLV